jgi:thiol-disulfide isomerase/thioredoxin
VKNTTAIMAAIALTAAAAGYLVAMLVAPADPGPSRLQSINSRAMTEGQIGDVVGLSRPDFTLSDDRGAPVSVDAFDGQLLLINFWATWCAPCVEEMPMLSELQQRYADREFRVLGIALDDPVKAAAFAAELDVQYPVLVGRADAVLVGREYGNRAGMLPYSVLVDRQGIIQWSHLGALVPEDLESRIMELL